MKCGIGVLAVVALAGALAAAELRILAPADNTVVRGMVSFRIQPKDAPTEMFFSNPEVVLEDETGRVVERLPAPKDTATGICSVPFDSTKVPDGLYHAVIRYRTLVRGNQPQDYREDLTLGVRNGPARPARFFLNIEQRDYLVGTQVQFDVRVYDQRRRLMPGARVAFGMDRGDLGVDADITDSTGEVFGSMEADEPGPAMLTVTVENLPPLRRVVRFVEKQ